MRRVFAEEIRTVWFAGGPPPGERATCDHGGMSLPEHAPASKRAIWEAAQRLFAENGYARTSVREIASEAAVDPALVIRHFGSKEQLFMETMEVQVAATAFEGPLETLGERFIAFILDDDADIRGIYLALLRASDSGGIWTHLRAAHEEGFVRPFRARIAASPAHAADADTRARMAAAVVGGLLYSLWVVRDEGLAHLERETVIGRYGALLQAAITG